MDAIPVHSEPKKGRKEVEVKPAPAEAGAQVDADKEAALAAQAVQLDEQARARQEREAAKEAAEGRSSYISDDKDGIKGPIGDREPKLVMQLANHNAVRVDH